MLVVVSNEPLEVGKMVPDVPYRHGPGQLIEHPKMLVLAEATEADYDASLRENFQLTDAQLSLNKMALFIKAPVRYFYLVSVD